MNTVANELSLLLDAPLLKDAVSEESLLAQLTRAVAFLIEKDFNRLVEILYRVDINEEVLKEKLSTSGIANTPEIIASMLLERQKQKLALRKQFHFPNENIPEDERW